MEDSELPTPRRRARTNTTSLMEEKLGLSANKTVQFKKGLQEAWESVADKHGNPNLSCDEIRDVLSVFGWADQIGEEALPLLVQHLDTDNDDRISFDEFMDGMKGWLAAKENAEDEGEEAGEEESELFREDSIDSTDRQFEQFEQFFTQFDKDGDGCLKHEELEELLEFLKGGKHLDAGLDPEGTSQAKQELIKVLSNQLQQMAAHSDGSITYDDFVNALRNIFVALQDFPLVLQPSTKAAPSTNSTESVNEVSKDNDELIRLRFDNAALTARQEQMERSLHEIEALNKKLTQDIKERNEELESAFKKIKSLQIHKDKSKEFSDQLEAQKEELSRLKKAEAELTKINTKLKAERDELIGKYEADGHAALSMKEEFEDALKMQNEVMADLQKTLQDRELSITSLQERNEQLTRQLEKINRESLELVESKNDLEHRLSQQEQRLSTAHSEVNTLRDRVKVLEAESQKTGSAAARPPSLQAELEALKTNDNKNTEEEELRKRVNEQTDEQKQKLERLEKVKQEEEAARQALETQMRQNKEEFEQKLQEQEQQSREEKNELQRLINEREAAMHKLEEELKRVEQERLEKEMKWTLQQKEVEASVKQLEQAKNEGTIELKRMGDRIDRLLQGRKKLRTLNKQLEAELKRITQELRVVEERRPRSPRQRPRIPPPPVHPGGGDQIHGFFSSLFMCCLPTQRPVFTDDGRSSLGMPETDSDAGEELRALRTNSKRRIVSVISPTAPLIRSDAEDDEEDELEAVRGAGVGLGADRVEDSTSSSGSSPSESEGITPDTSEAEKEPEGKSESESELEWSRPPG